MNSKYKNNLIEMSHLTSRIEHSLPQLDALFNPIYTNREPITEIHIDKINLYIQAFEKLKELMRTNISLQNEVSNVVFYSDNNSGKYGGYSRNENTIYINEASISDGVETADTVSHEMRHCWQHERAENPQTEQDYSFKENLDNYVPADENYDVYKNQIVEQDASDYAKSVTEPIRSHETTEDSSLTVSEPEQYGPSYTELNQEKGAVFDERDNVSLPEDINSKKLDHYDVVDGKVGGRIPLEEHNEILNECVHNKDADTMTLGKYMPTEKTDGSLDYNTPGPDSYNTIAEQNGDTYFSIENSKWYEIEEKHSIDDDDMFEIYNKRAIDDAVRSGKEIRFTHHPSEYENSNLMKEWDYLKSEYGYKKLIQEGDYWYARK